MGYYAICNYDNKIETVEFFCVSSNLVVRDSANRRLLRYRDGGSNKFGVRISIMIYKIDVYQLNYNRQTRVIIYYGCLEVKLGVGNSFFLIREGKANGRVSSGCLN